MSAAFRNSAGALAGPPPQDPDLRYVVQLVVCKKVVLNNLLSQRKAVLNQFIVPKFFFAISA